MTLKLKSDEKEILELEKQLEQRTNSRGSTTDDVVVFDNLMKVQLDHPLNTINLPEVRKSSQPHIKSYKKTVDSEQNTMMVMPTNTRNSVHLYEDTVRYSSLNTLGI